MQSSVLPQKCWLNFEKAWKICKRREWFCKLLIPSAEERFDQRGWWKVPNFGSFKVEIGYPFPEVLLVKIRQETLGQMEHEEALESPQGLDQRPSSVAALNVEIGLAQTSSAQETAISVQEPPVRRQDRTYDRFRTRSPRFQSRQASSRRGAPSIRHGTGMSRNRRSESPVDEAQQDDDDDDDEARLSLLPDRFFDALDGPELENLKVGSSFLLSLELQTWILKLFWSICQYCCCNLWMSRSMRRSWCFQEMKDGHFFCAFQSAASLSAWGWAAKWSCGRIYQAPPSCTSCISLCKSISHSGAWLSSSSSSSS